MKKSGFGILEVLAAAVVLGFLIVGLTQLQKGNREAILRIRTRDAANIIAQHVLDSLGSIGINALKEDDECEKDYLLCGKEYKYYFEGKPQIDKSKGDAIKIEIPYTVEVKFLEDDDAYKSDNTTYYKIANNENSTNEFAKKLEATVSWEFKKTPQSITMAKVVR